MCRQPTHGLACMQNCTGWPLNTSPTVRPTILPVQLVQMRPYSSTVDFLSVPVQTYCALQLERPITALLARLTNACRCDLLLWLSPALTPFLRFIALYDQYPRNQGRKAPNISPQTPHTQLTFSVSSSSWSSAVRCRSLVRSTDSWHSHACKYAQTYVRRRVHDL